MKKTDKDHAEDFRDEELSLVAAWNGWAKHRCHCHQRRGFDGSREGQCHFRVRRADR